MHSRKPSRRSAAGAGVVAFLLGLSVPAAAQTVLFDFGNDDSFRGLTVSNPDDNGNYWNSFRTGLFYTNLVDTNNNATTIDFGFSTPVATDSYNGPAGVTSDSTLLDDVQFTDVDRDALGLLAGALEAPFDFVAGGPGAVRFEIQQLDPAKTYDLTFFGSHKYSTDTTTVYSVYTDNTYSTLVDSAELDVQDPDFVELHNRDKVVTISNLSPQTDNILYVEFVGESGAEGYLNAMQLDGISNVVAGDFNSDTVVDAADYARWRDNLGLDESALGGAGDGSGTVDAGDYEVWTANYGGAVAASPGVAAPEPSTILLAFAAAAGLGLGSRECQRRA